MKKINQDVKKVVLRWMQFSNENLEDASHMIAAKPESTALACWLCQQSAEKAIKAALISEGIRFPPTHDFKTLLRLLPGSWIVKDKHKDLRKLGVWTVNARYPGDWPRPTQEDAVMSKSIADSVYNSVIADLGRRGIYLGDIQGE